MTGYRYHAVNADGRVVRGELPMSTAAEVTAELSRQGLFPTRITSAPPERRAKPDPRDVTAALQALAAMSEVGVPLHRALEAAASLVPASLKGVLLRVRDAVREGKSLSGALQSEPSVFSPVTVGLISAGERG